MKREFVLNLMTLGCRGSGSHTFQSVEERTPPSNNYIRIDNYYQFNEANAYG